ncbi:hypothetical protein [Aeromonas sobria]|uniref:hypothetical protein n=1 Tax=Aeromonas sobria TaxID=646 RepID=UPI003D073E61
MTAELDSLLARVDDVVDRMPASFNTYEFVQKLALHHQGDYFAAGHSLGSQSQPVLKLLHGRVGAALAGSDRLIEGAHLPCLTPWGEAASSPRWHRKV